VSFPAHFSALLAATAALTITSIHPAVGQVVYPYPPYPATAYDSSVHFDVKPQQAEVFVDGYYAGIVDSFDGMFQRLRVEPGQHEIVLYLDGYRTARQQVYLAPDRTFKIGLQMEPLAPGEVGEARPVPSPRGVQVQPSRPLPRTAREIPSTGVPPPDPTQGTPAASATGQLTIRIQPADANVIIDGQPWPAQGPTIAVDLSEGRHVVQVRRAGYVGYLTEVQVRRGETTTLTVSLRTQP
jgi:hypothetical protein